MMNETTMPAGDDELGIWVSSIEVPPRRQILSSSLTEDNINCCSKQRKETKRQHWGEAHHFVGVVQTKKEDSAVKVLI